MINRRNWLAALVCGAIAALLGTSTVSAQTYGTDYLTFRGEGVILDNPIPAACSQNSNFNFGSTLFFIYRFSANPGLVADAIDFTSGSGGAFRIVSTPGSSLNGTTTINWSVFNRLGNFNSGTSTSTITISSGLGAPVTTGTGNLKFVNGHVSNFFGITGCDITNFHGAAVAVPQ